MSKKHHHSKRSCLEDTSENKKEYKKRKHHKKHQKKHSKEIPTDLHIKENPITNIVEENIDNNYCETNNKLHSEDHYNDHAKHLDAEYSEEEFAHEDYSKDEYSEGEFDHEEYSKDGYSEEEFDHEDYSKDEYSEEEFDQEDYSKNEYSEEEFNHEEYSKEEYSEEEFDHEDYSTEEYSEEEYSEEEFDHENYSTKEYSEEEFDQEDYYNYECSENNFDQEDCFHEDSQSHIDEDKLIDDCDIITCEASAETEILSFCPNTPGLVMGTKNPVVIKTPVVLAEPTIQISAESKLRLESPALEIKRIIKNVYLEQCNLIPEIAEPCFGTLFIKGFIRKNIEYATEDCCDNETLNGRIRHTTVKIPFTCAARIHFTTLPIFTETEPPTQLEIFKNNMRICNPCEEGTLGNPLCQLNLKLTEFFNEKVFCELVKAEIIESDFLENPSKNNYRCNLDQTYNEVKEKVIIHLTIKLLQNQQVSING